MSKAGQLVILVLLTIGLGLGIFKRTLDYDYIWLIPSCIFCGCMLGYFMSKYINKGVIR
jgi:hypothetical protein